MENKKGLDQKVLVKLIDRLNSYPVGLPDAPEIREFLSIFLEEDEAHLASIFPLKETTVEEMAEISGWNPEKTEKVLDRMADKGTVIDFKINEENHFWMLTPSIIGFIEFSLMKVHKDKPMKQMALLLHKYEHNVLWKEVFGSKTQLTRTLVEHDVPVSSEIMTYTQVAEVIKAAGDGAVQTCFCRHQTELIGNPCKITGHKETCIGLGNASSFMVRRGFGRRASVEELLDLTRRLGEMGLIHVTDNVRDKPSFICNCCGCCCGLLTGIIEKKIPHAISPTPYILKVDSEKCIGCGLCSKKCQISAVKTENKLAFVDEKNCLGCGSCIKFCKQGALSLKERRKKPKLPKNSGTRFAKIAFEKGRLFKLILPSIKSKLFKHVG